jgi:molybdopterin-guanine dinucleotide biosynthesis adapter protein
MRRIPSKGFKRADLPKIEVFRPENEKPPACREDPNLMAVVSDARLEWGVPRYAFNDFEGLVEFVLARFGLEPFMYHGSKQTACG